MQEYRGEADCRIDTDSPLFAEVQRLFATGLDSNAEKARELLCKIREPREPLKLMQDVEVEAEGYIKEKSAKEIAAMFNISDRTVNRWRLLQRCRKCRISKPVVAFDRIKGPRNARRQVCRKCSPVISAKLRERRRRQGIVRGARFWFKLKGIVPQR